MSKKRPTRFGNEISQQFNSGIVKVYSVSDGARPGYKPQPLLRLKHELRYDERRLGIQRLYAARQVQAAVDRVIRTPKQPDISPQDIAETEDGQRYSIDTVQTVPDVWPPSLDLALVRTTVNFDGMV